jgi:very-short-patch-repair endonuclease
VHRLHVDDVTILRSVPITSVARTLVDLAAVLPAQVVERAMHEAEVLRLFDARKLQEALARAPTARGTRRLRAMLAESSPGMTRSALEERFLALCRATRLPLPRLNLHIPTRQGLLEVDAYWPSVRLIVELDGEASHLTSRAFHTDRRRDTALAAEGYLVMRFTSQRVARDPEGIRTELARVFALRSSSGPD